MALLDRDWQFIWFSVCHGECQCDRVAVDNASRLFLFFRFKPDEDIHKKENLKTSAARKIKKDLQEAYPSIEGNIDEFFPKKETMIVYKTRDYMEFLVVNGEIYFFRYRNGPFLPTLRLVHKCTFY